MFENSNGSFKHGSITSGSNRRSRSENYYKLYNRPPLNYSERRSRSPYRLPSHSKRKYKRRSRSNSRSGDRQRNYRSLSQDSATKSSRDDERSRRLNIFFLNYKTKTHQLFKIFKKYGFVEKINVIVDETGKSRGFGFAVFQSSKDSEKVLKKCSGMKIDGKKILIEYSNMGRSPTPIPGISMNDLDITPTWRRAYDERYYKDRTKYYRESSPSTMNVDSTYKKKSHKDRSRSRSWPLHWA